MKEKIDQYVGKNAEITIGGLTIAVLITDYKQSYGKDRFLVTPIKGSGSTWVETVSMLVSHD